MLRLGTTCMALGATLFMAPAVCLMAGLLYGLAAHSDVRVSPIMDVAFSWGYYAVGVGLALVLAGVTVLAAKGKCRVSG